MTIWQRPVSLELFNERAEGTMAEHLDIHFCEYGDNYLCASMPVDHRTRQPLGIMNGGASCVLAETVGSTAGNFCVDFAHYCVGLDINCNHIRSVKSGRVIANVEPVHLGRSTQVWQIFIRDEKQQLIALSRLTLVVLANNQ